MISNGIKSSKHSRPTYEMYSTTLITLRDLARDSVYRSGSCQRQLLALRKFVEYNFEKDFGSPAASFINLMYGSFC